MSVLEVQPTLLLPGAPRRTTRVADPVHAIVFATGYLSLTDCEPFARTVLAASSKELESLACCLMPDRFEWLLADRRKLVPKVERVLDVSTCVATRLGISEPLWSGGCVELPIEAIDLEAAARAIQELPVREGLVATVPEWPYQMRRI